MATAFQVATRAWRALLADATHARVMEEQYDDVMRVVAVLAQSKPTDEHVVDWDAIRSRYKEEEDEQAFLALVFVVQDVVEAIVRDRMTFLLDDVRTSEASDEQTALQREAVAHQEALVLELPERFRVVFLETLRSQWKELEQDAAAKSATRPKLEQFDWRVIGSVVLMRLVTSDGTARVFKVPAKQFHQLRYSTAKVLQEMNQVEAHPIMRLAHMEQSKHRGVVSEPHTQVP
ncbi:hypothetical protein Poli38472_011823 [Pythium oligandrum]|uniref:COMM domain-containing protein n=1 Tax=Pythium oligandrum TaxID=41045 RepID=A0A8K1C8I4_PYTOL|nr:hypothetical protein Poli38472_011823 [Pythium oligandrum]|eukprot:TMW58235.1 hypothetical protein Poli38472_011823 [Pythium oligandrum]